VRRAANRKPATYRCPICGHHLPALSEHMLIAPEGDTRRRRHAHAKCVMAARRRGELVQRDEWLRAQPRPPSWWRKLLRHARSDPARREHDRPNSTHTARDGLDSTSERDRPKATRRPRGS
jgi:hypothetical protein